MVIASALTDVLEVAGVWVMCIGLGTGAGAAWALKAGLPGAEVANEAARGAGSGFIIGFPVTIAAGIISALA